MTVTKRWRIRWIMLAAALTASAMAIGAGPSPAAPTSERALDDVGEEVFWEGETIKSAHVPDREACGVAGPCWEYDLEVAESIPGAALRVAFTAVLAAPGQVRPWADFLAKSPEMHFKLELYAPGMDRAGTPYESRENGFDGIHGYSREMVIGGIDAAGAPLPAPPDGTWTLRVIPMSVTDIAFRMRAALKDERAIPEGRQLPDLRLNPPFELNFATVGGTYQPGIETTGSGPHPSCMAEEVAEAVQSGFPAPSLCLRFSMGLENVGTGIFELAWNRPADEVEAVSGAGGVTMRSQLQRVCDFLGQTCEFLPDRGAQTVFHAGHAHEHWQDAWSVELFRVLEPNVMLQGRAPRMSSEGPARKLGINPGAELIADFDRIYRRSTAVAGDSSGCFAEDGGPCSGFLPIALAAGFADLYEWNRGGNYVDFPQNDLLLTPEHGVYVLKGTIDPRNLVAESNEENNDSYAIFEVEESGAVQLIERGYGESPWDNKKAVSEFAP